MVGADVGSQPARLVAEVFVTRMLGQKSVECPDQCAPVSPLAWEFTRRSKDETEVALARIEPPQVHHREVVQILGHEAAPLGGGGGEERRIIKRHQVGAFGHGDDIVTAPTEFDGHRAVVLLVEQQLQRSVARSRRHAASASAAAASLAAMRSSISSRLAA